MKIIVLQASPRKIGNSNTLVDEMIKSIKENGHTVKKYFLEDLNINTCKACMYCQNHDECIRDDDGNTIINDLLNSDGVIFSTPIYYGEMSAQGKLIIDRFYSISLNPNKSLKGKAALIFTQAAPEGYYTDYMEHVKNSAFEHIGYNVIGILEVGSVSEIREVNKRQDKLKEAYELGKMF